MILTLWKLFSFRFIFFKIWPIPLPPTTLFYSFCILYDVSSEFRPLSSANQKHGGSLVLAPAVLQLHVWGVWASVRLRGSLWHHHHCGGEDIQLPPGHPVCHFTLFWCYVLFRWNGNSFDCWTNLQLFLYGFILIMKVLIILFIFICFRPLP